MGSTAATRTLSPGPSGLWVRARVAWLLAGLLCRQFLIKCRAHVQEHDAGPTRQSRSPRRESRSRSDRVTLAEHSAAGCSSGPAAPTVVRMLHAPLRKLRAAWGFLQRMSAHNRQLLRLCATALDEAASRGCREVVLYGDGEAARILSTLSQCGPARIRAICPFGPAIREVGRRPYGELWSVPRLAEWSGTVIVAAFVNTEKRTARLRELGIPDERVVVIAPAGSD